LLARPGLLPLVKVIDKAATALEGIAEGRPVLDPLGLALMFANPTLMSLDQKGTKPQRAKSRLRSPALASKRTMGS
jgi:hypothetical protein